MPFHPVRLFSLLVAQHEEALILLRSFFVDLLDAAERVMPVLTPETLQDDQPLMAVPAMTAAATATPSVEFRALRKRFGRLTALDGVDITVAAGRVTALVGPNGAGKSTLIKCLLGLVRPDEGAIAPGRRSAGRRL